MSEKYKNEFRKSMTSLGLDSIEESDYMYHFKENTKE
jgi:hypothetical protein